MYSLNIENLTFFGTASLGRGKSSHDWIMFIWVGINILLTCSLRPYPKSQLRLYESCAFWEGLRWSHVCRFSTLYPSERFFSWWGSVFHLLIWLGVILWNLHFRLKCHFGSPNYFPFISAIFRVFPVLVSQFLFFCIFSDFSFAIRICHNYNVVCRIAKQMH